MTPPQPPQLDIVTVAIAISAALFGSELGGYVGPYTVIFLGALLGAAWSASRLPPRSRLSTIGYLAAVMLLALLITVPAAEAAAHYTGFQSQALLAPVAAVITGIGPDWPGVIRWAMGIVQSVVERWAKPREAQDTRPGADQ